MNYSLVYSGLITSFAVPLIGHFGFSEACSNEVIQYVLLPLPGIIMAAYGRYRLGGVTPLGVKPDPWKS